MAVKAPIKQQQKKKKKTTTVKRKKETPKPITSSYYAPPTAKDSIIEPKEEIYMEMEKSKERKWV